MCQYGARSYMWLDGKLKSVDQCIVPLILQLRLAGVTTLGCCCGHGGMIPNVVCAPGSEEALEKFGCKRFETDPSTDKVVAYFPTRADSGYVSPRCEHEWVETDAAQRHCTQCGLVQVYDLREGWM